MTDKFEDALASLQLALARAHMRHNHNGTVSMVKAYNRIVPGEYLKVGDTIVDAFDKKRTVTEVGKDTVTFDDFSKQPKNAPYRLIDKPVDGVPPEARKADELRQRQIDRHKSQDPFKSTAKDPFVNKVALSSAITDLQTAVTKKSDEVPPTPKIEGFFRFTSGRDLKIGDVVVGEDGKDRTVTAVTQNSVTFNDFSTKDLTEMFRVRGSVEELTKKPEIPTPEPAVTPTPVVDTPAPTPDTVSPVPTPATVAPLSAEAEEEDQVELTAVKVEGHERRSKSGKIYHVGTYVRKVFGHQLEKGDTVKDSYGRTKTVDSVTNSSLSFSDGSSAPLKSKFEVIKKWSAKDTAPKTNAWNPPQTPAISKPDRKLRSLKAAEILFNKAVQEEPSITSTVKAAANKIGGSLTGLENKFKSVDSLAKKLEKDSIIKGTSPEAQSKSVSDSLRYTVIHNNDAVVNAVQAMQTELESQGHKLLSTHNGWAQGLPFKGFNSSYTSPNGMPYEIQFHTPASYKARKDSEKELQIISDLNSPLRLRQAAWQRLMNIWLIPFPIGWARIGQVSYHTNGDGPDRRNYL